MLLLFILQEAFSKDVTPLGVISYPHTASSHSGTWVSLFVGAQSQAEYCLREEDHFSTIHSYMCLFPAHFYFSFPLIRWPDVCGPTCSHLTRLLHPSGSQEDKIRWAGREMLNGELRGWGWECLLIHLGSRTPKI